MHLKRADRKLVGKIVGWSAALAVALVATLNIVSYINRPLDLMLLIDGKEICRVEDRTVVDEALLLLDEKLEADGIIYTDKDSISYKFVSSSSKEVADVNECMQLIYENSFEDYSRAYMISFDGKDIAACPTYSDAEIVISALKDKIAELVKENGSSNSSVELTTDIGIRSVFCEKSKIDSADSICKYLNGTPDSDTSDRVPAIGGADGSSGNYLPKDEEDSIKNENSFSFNMNGIYSAIGFNTVELKNFTEILPFETERIESDEYYIGHTVIESEGQNGVAENTYEITSKGDEEISRVLVSSTVISRPVKHIEIIGTKPLPEPVPTGSFIWPVECKFTITSYFGTTRDEFEDYFGFHSGLDIAGTKIGEPIYAADGGTVIFAGNRGNYGIMVKIQHEDGVVTFYSHMKNFCVKEGDKVYKGQKIGEVGMTGLTTGPHLHFEVRINDKVQNPMNYLPKRK